VLLWPLRLLTPGGGQAGNTATALLTLLPVLAHGLFRSSTLAGGL